MEKNIFIKIKKGFTILFAVLVAVMMPLLLSISSAFGVSPPASSNKDWGDIALGYIFGQYMQSFGAPWMFAAFFLFFIGIIFIMFRFPFILYIFMYTIVFAVLIMLGALPFPVIAIPFIMISGIIAMGFLKYLASIWFGG